MIPETWLTPTRLLRRGARLCAVLLALMAAPVAAQTPQDTVPPDTTVIPVEGLLVEAPRTATVTGGSSALLLRLDSLRMPAALTLDLVLRAVPLLKVRTNSRGEAELSLRGSEGRQVAVLFDGVPLTLGWDHRIDLALVPTTGAQSLTLLRGLSSVLHGPNVLGGVLEVGVARAPFVTPPSRSLQLFGGADHVGARSAGTVGSSSFRWHGGNLLVRAGAGYRARPGVETPADAPGAADADGLRTNSDLEQHDGFLALRYRGRDGGWLSFSASGFRGERGVPPETHVAEPRFWRYPETGRLVAALSGGTAQSATPFGTGDLEASVGIDLGHTQLESYESAAYQRVVGRESADDRTLTLRLLGDHTLGESGELRAAFTYADVQHDEVLEPGTSGVYEQRLWSVGSEVAWTLSRRAVPLRDVSGARLSGGIALDGADTPESGDKPPLGALSAWGARLGFSALAGGSTLLHASLSRRARFPSLRELYSGALGRFAPNPALRPEVLLAGEGGFTTRRGAVELQVVGFHQWLTDAIVRTSLGDGRFQRANRGEQRSTGLELLASGRMGAASLAADMTWQRVRVYDDVARERRAEYQPALAASLDLAVPAPLGTRVSAIADYSGRQWCVHPERDELMALESARRLDLEVARAWRLRARGAALSQLRASLAVDNVADTTIYEQCGLPAPGRTLRFQLRMW